MPVMDEFQEEREEIKKQPFKKRAEYFWEYYKWWVIGGIVAIIAIVMTVKSFMTRKNDVLYIALINTEETTGADIDGSITEPFLTAHDYDTKKNTLNFDTDFIIGLNSNTDTSENSDTEDSESETSNSSSASAGTGQSSLFGSSSSYSSGNTTDSRQNLSVYIAAGTVDLMYSSEAWFDEYAYNGFYTDLSEVFTQEELEKYSDCLYYIDKAVLDRYDSARDDMNYNYDESYPENKEDMEEPIPVGFIMDSYAFATTDFTCITEKESDHTVLGIIANSSNKELAGDLIISLLNQD